MLVSRMWNMVKMVGFCWISWPSFRTDRYYVKDVFSRTYQNGLFCIWGLFLLILNSWVRNIEVILKLSFVQWLDNSKTKRFCVTSQHLALSWWEMAASDDDEIFEMVACQEDIVFLIYKRRGVDYFFSTGGLWKNASSRGYVWAENQMWIWFVMVSGTE